MSKPNGKPVGRPPQYTPERCAAIIQSIADHIPYQLAAEANGICEETLYDWLRDGLAHMQAGIDSELARFSEAVKKTEQNKIREHSRIVEAMPERWQARAWLLERRWWQHFSPNAAIVEFNKKLDRLAKENMSENGKAIVGDLKSELEVMKQELKNAKAKSRTTK